MTLRPTSTPITPCGRLQRRTFLADAGMGFTGLALGAMFGEDGIGPNRPRCRDRFLVAT
ncbi:MAG: hypothetical protein CM1200mP2_30130 [Planctomycetaceae bacterium]|nr:MAG: hypothetical protein CM1200mP2_30130 [Planctomycetaceae bacterium]